MNSDCCNSLSMSDYSNTTPPQPLFVYHTFAIHLQYIYISIVLFYI